MTNESDGLSVIFFYIDYQLFDDMTVEPKEVTP